MDFFVVPTATFRALFVLLILARESRRIRPFRRHRLAVGCVDSAASCRGVPMGRGSAVSHPRSRRDLHGLRERVKRIGIAELITAARSPLQNPYVERVSRTIRRELLTHATLLDKRHLQPRLRAYVDYYQPARTHLSLDKDTPELRAVEPVSTGPIRAVAEVGGLHHRYFRRAA